MELIGQRKTWLCEKMSIIQWDGCSWRDCTYPKWALAAATPLTTLIKVTYNLLMTKPSTALFLWTSEPHVTGNPSLFVGALALAFRTLNLIPLFSSTSPPSTAFLCLILIFEDSEDLSPISHDFFVHHLSKLLACKKCLNAAEDSPVCLDTGFVLLFTFTSDIRHSRGMEHGLYFNGGGWNLVLCTMTGDHSVTKLHISSSAQSTTLDFLLLPNLLLSWCHPSQQLSALEHWGQECWSFLVALCPFSLTLGPSAIHVGCGCTSHMKSLVSLGTTHAEAVPSLPSCLCWPAWMPLIHFSRAASKLSILSKMWSPWPHPSAPNFQWPLFMFRMKLFYAVFSDPCLSIWTFSMHFLSPLLSIL